MPQSLPIFLAVVGAILLLVAFFGDRPFDIPWIGHFPGLQNVVLRALAGVLGVLLLVASLFTYTLSLPSTTSTSPATPTPTPTAIPTVALTKCCWSGTAYNSTTRHTGNIKISMIQSSTSQLIDGKLRYPITGTYTVSSPFVGNGPLQGWIDSGGNIDFQVNSDQVQGLTLHFIGTFPANQTELQGTFTTSRGENGSWRVTPV